MIPFIPPKFNVGPNTYEFRGAVLGQLFRVQDASSTAACMLGLFISLGKELPENGVNAGFVASGNYHGSS